MAVPGTTRLRYVRSKDPDQLIAFLAALTFRVQVYGSPVWDGKKWILWFVPPDDVTIDVPSGDLDA